MIGGRDLLLIARDNWRTLSEINWIFLREDDDFGAAFETLVKTIEIDPEHVRQHTRLLLRSKEWETNGRKAAYALRGDDLRQAEIWLVAAEGKDPPPTPCIGIISPRARRRRPKRTNAVAT